jgi:2-amino-4-hydroxy-6-hydroxymethyldihydropteridine diphosphokinase
MPSDAPETTRIGLGLGSNIGNKPGNVRAALARLAAENICEIAAVSSIYRTAPWGYLDQESFANACALAWTKLSPQALLTELKRIEGEMGREKTLRWGPRLIDIDMLFYGDASLATPDLILPHKELFNRAFVLVPLAEIAPDLHIAGRSIAEAAARLDTADIAKWPDEPD